MRNEIILFHVLVRDGRRLISFMMLSDKQPVMLLTNMHEKNNLANSIVIGIKTLLIFNTNTKYMFMTRVKNIIIY